MKRTCTDQMGHSITLAEAPQRIISLVPSQTELLFDLGLEDRIVGLTKFCVHPKEQCRQKPQIGGTKNFHLDRIRDLNPDLILGNKEENYQEGIQALQKDYPVWMSDIETLPDALAMISSVGELTGTMDKAISLQRQIQKSFQELRKSTRKAKVAYFIWRNPYMVAASGTFIDHLLEFCGWQNCFAHLERYPEIRQDLLSTQAPDYIFLSSEPFPFKATHVEEFQEICPQSQVCIVDGRCFPGMGVVCNTVQHILNNS